MPLEERDLDGLWRYAAYEEGGVKHSPEQLATMATLVLLVGEYLPGWAGLWAVVTWDYLGGTWSEEDIRATCRHTILGDESEGSAPAASDFYLWAGGRFRTASRLSPREIDFEQYWRGEVLPSANLGLYTAKEGRLILCLAESGKPRPTGFTTSGKQPHQSLGELVRWTGGQCGE